MVGDKTEKEYPFARDAVELLKLPKDQGGSDMNESEAIQAVQDYIQENPSAFKTRGRG